MFTGAIFGDHSGGTMTTGRDAIAALPELPLEPFELAGYLAHARRGPYVTIVPEKLPLPAPPPPPPHAVPRGQFETRQYWALVTYPRVFCHDPGDLLDGLALDPGPSAPPARQQDLPALVTRERHYKLSALKGVRFRHPLFCTVKGGPWTAFVVETESCTNGVPNRWELNVSGIPEISLVWYGLWLDQPAFPNLTVIKNSLQLSNVTLQCCPGNQWCPTTESCIPLALDCQDIIPA
jgi:hypothetical protein